MPNQYLLLKTKHQKEFNEFPMMFAFSDKQFEEGMEKLGLKKEDTDKVYASFGGGFYRKTDAEELRNMFSRQDKEMKDAIAGDLKGDGFILDMFKYELANHEYGYTREIDSTLDALGYTIDEISADNKLLKGLLEAMRIIREEDEF